VSVQDAPAEREHVVSIVVDGREARNPTEYQIDVGMLDPADTFTMTWPADEELWETVRTDRPVKVWIDGVPRLTGYLDEPEYMASAGTITVRGRCKVGRLVQESAEAVNYHGLTLTKVVAKLASPWFGEPVLSNARNRTLMRGRGKKAASADRVYLDKVVGKRIEPGQMKWSVIEDLCREAGYICRASADGKELVIGQPDYAQEIQHRFVAAAPGSARRSNVIDLSVRPSTADRYSRIIVLGSGAATTANYGLPAAARAGEAKDNALTTNGEGGDFSARKVLVIADQEVKDRRTAELRAQREMARRNMRREVVVVTAPRHGQLVQGRYPTLYTPDTLAHVEAEVIGLRGVYLIVACSYRGSRAGETTTLELLPKGTELAP
jgi:prophage tail gpP-like protein